MILRFIIPILSLFGVLVAIYFTQHYGVQQTPPARQLTEPPATPYNETVSGTGIVEASSRNIQVGSHLSGIVQSLKVSEGQAVEKGEALFVLDTREAEALLAEAAAAVNAAAVALEDEQDQLQRAEGLKLGTSISMELLQRRRYAVKRAAAALVQARAQKQSAATFLARHSVYAPIAGKILKLRLREGEFVTAGAQQAPIVMGQDNPLYLRVAVDENDIWRYTQDSPAIAVLRSNKELEYPLQFVRVEPLVLPKKELSGDPSEKVDTRVLEVIYEIKPQESSAENPTLYIGQQLDVFIEGE
jgi:HlyD family secretion protein